MSNRRLPTIQTRLVFSVNSVLFVFVLLFLYMDYRSTLWNRLDDKKQSLVDEAKSILPAVIHLNHHGRKTVQDYIDEVCERMESQQSPMHHIGVSVDQYFLQSQSHSHHWETLPLHELAKMEDENQFVEYHGKRFSIGKHSDLGTTIFVIEEICHIQKQSLFIVGQHFVAIFLLSVMAALIVNVLMYRLVRRPVKRLVDQVRKIESGEYQATPTHSRTQEFSFLFTEVNKMSESLLRASRRQQASLERARKIQLNLLPKQLDDLPGLKAYHHYSPAEEVGGDFFDIRSCGSNQWFICVADSAGHGVPAAMSAAMIKSLLFKPDKLLAEPAQLISVINSQYMLVHPLGEFASVFVGFADLDSAIFKYANAGHGPVIYYPDSSDDSTELLATGTPLGINEEGQWSEGEVKLANDSRLVITTDGITETFGPNDELFGNERLLANLCSGRNSEPKQLVEDLLESVSKFRGNNKQYDDVTVLALDFQL